MEDIKFVINYDFPNSSEDYVHRIGRTARSTNKGTAYTFFTPGNIRQARDLIRVLEEARQAINPKLLQLVDTGRGGGGGGRMRYRGNNLGSNNPNLMYQVECDHRMRSVTGSNKGSRSNMSQGSGGSSRDDHMSSSYRDRSRDGRNNYNSGPSYNSGVGDQYKSCGGGGGGQYSSRGGGTHGGGAGGQDQAGPPRGLFGAPPPTPPQPGPGLQPLMAQQFHPPPQPIMGLMGPEPYPFASPPPRK